MKQKKKQKLEKTRKSLQPQEKGQVEAEQRVRVPDASMLPPAFLERMHVRLGDAGYQSFLACYSPSAESWRGLRFNRKKARKETIEKLKKAWELIPVPWCPDGFYYREQSGRIRPGKSPYHAAGVFYIQEPSAMLPAEEAEIHADELVLDLCAAPGGKSTQAAARAGLLISNEFIPKRAKLLSSAIERLGFSNVIVCSAPPAALSECCPSLFDKILVDAPCSGEGMFRREPAALSEWSEENVELCIARQRDILEEAEKMLRPGGRLVYSTCTFEPGENTEQIADFLKRHPAFRLIRMHQLFPHEEKGEGHFCAVLEKEGEGRPYFSEKVQDGCSKTERLKAALKAFTERLKRHGIHVLRSGVQPGETRIGAHEKAARYIPSHAEVIAETGITAENRVNLKDEALALRYLAGESIDLSEAAGVSPEQYEITGGNGYCAVCYDGYPLGLGKRSRFLVKNAYPKGLRQTL